MRPMTWGSFVLFASVCGAVGVTRLVEMSISRAHQAWLATCGAQRHPERVFPFMKALHAAVIVGGPLEVLLFARAWWPPLTAVALLFFLAAQGLRWWVIRSLGVHWNIQIVSSTSQVGVVTSGPYRWIRHPNYVAVLVELLALPLLHGAWVTAVLGLAAHAAILAARIRAEEAVLFADPLYRATMSGKPRFVPHWSKRVAARPLAGELVADDV